MIIGLNLLCFGWFCLILLCPLVWLICSLKTQIFNLPRVVKFLASNLRQFQADKINFTVKSAKFKIIALKNQPKSTKFKQNLTNKLCVFCARLCLVLLFCCFAVFVRHLIQIRLWFFCSNIHFLLCYVFVLACSLCLKFALRLCFFMCKYQVLLIF